MDGVGHKVLQDLLQPHSVAPHGQGSAGIGPQLHSFVGGFGLTGAAHRCSQGFQPGAVLIEQDLLLLQLGRQKQVLGQPAHKAHPLLQHRQQRGQGVRRGGQRVQPAADDEQRAAQGWRSRCGRCYRVSPL